LNWAQLLGSLRIDFRAEKEEEKEEEEGKDVRSEKSTVTFPLVEFIISIHVERERFV